MARRLWLIGLGVLALNLGGVFAVEAQLEQHGESESSGGYVGSSTCARCHANTYESFTQTWHPNMLRPADEGTILGDFGSDDPDLSFSREEVVWVIGGNYKQRYLTEIEGELYVLPAEWDIQSQEWFPYETTTWREMPYRTYCAGCHTTGFDPASQTWVEPGIGCEACHGPGANHVGSTGNRSQIANPADMRFEEQAAVCAQCHSRGSDPSGEFPYPVGYHPGGPADLSEAFVLSTEEGDYWPDGTAKRHHMQFQDWRQSVHRDSVGCIFCHTSHAPGETDHQTRMVGNDRCTICHEGNRDLAAHIPFMASAADQVECTDCHMPPVSRSILTDLQIRSHTFRPPDPRLSIAYGGQDEMPNACNLCHQDRTPAWAVASLGLRPLDGSATRVPPPTPLPFATSAIALDARSEVNPQPMVSVPEPGPAPLWTWLAGLAVLIFIALGARSYQRRRGR